MGGRFNRAFAALGGVVLTGLAAPALAQSPAPATAPPACATPEHRALDFWIGQWAVHDEASGALIGENDIRLLWNAARCWRTSPAPTASAAAASASGTPPARSGA